MTDEYELIVASASRPHLLKRTLGTLLANVDVKPARLLVHDDAAFPRKFGEIQDVVRSVAEFYNLPYLLMCSDPPIRHGPALRWLVDHVITDFVLYTQDDHEVVRPIPVRTALRTMGDYRHVNQIRFNKRATREWKDTWQGRWYKKQVTMGTFESIVLTISDHWYFQTGLWRTGVIRYVLANLTAMSSEKWKHSIEESVNQFLDFVASKSGESGEEKDPRDPVVRAASVGTFIWGPIGEDRYIQHIGDKPEDWAGDHPREAHR